VDQRSVVGIARVFQETRVRYLIVGGLAVIAHGYVRFTSDVDIVLDMEPDNLRRAVSALGRLGYRPRAPVPLESFADAATRESWIRDRHMLVFSLWNPQSPATEVDLFVASPFDFSRAYAAAVRRVLEPGVEATFVGLDDLLELKAKAGREVDKDDIIKLKGVPRDSGPQRPAGT
jgi:hypothetical protein